MKQELYFNEELKAYIFQEGYFCTNNNKKKIKKKSANSQKILFLTSARTEIMLYLTDLPFNFMIKKEWYFP